MATATVTSKGQVTIPARVRSALGLKTGSRIEFVEAGRRKFTIVPADSPLLALEGILRKPRKPVTIEMMNEAIAIEGAKAGDRTR
jgi:antitoxin PrlF